MVTQGLSFARSALVAAAFTACAAMPVAAAPVSFFTYMSGPAEAPPNASPGIGTAWISFDVDAHSMRVVADFSGLLSPTTVAHIHCCTALPGVSTASVATTTPTFPGFPAGVTSGHYDATFDMTLASSYRAGFIAANGGTTAGAEAALFAGLVAGKAYFNVHTRDIPTGEIRGFFRIPEPASYMLGLGALAMLGLSRRRRVH